MTRASDLSAIEGLALAGTLPTASNPSAKLMRLYLQPVLLLVLCLLGLSGPSLAQNPAPPPVLKPEATSSGGYRMTDSGGGVHTWEEIDVENGYVTAVSIDGKEYIWDEEGLRYYRPGVTPPDFSYYQFYSDGQGGYTYQKKVPQIGGTATIEEGTLTQ